MVQPTSEEHKNESSAGADRLKWMGPEQGRVYAKINGPDGTVYLVSKERVIIGRESTHNECDLIVQENNYVSRGHLVLQRSTNGHWQLECNGKNGVFIDSQLVKKDSGFVPVPKQCMLRFPSTAVRLVFQSFVDFDADLAPLSPAGIEASKQLTVSLQDSGFLSPSSVVSPSAVNSCPASPRNLVNRKRPLEAEMMENGKLDGTNDVEDVMDSDDMAEADGKPPYSYAQLIIQAIASTSDRQMTLSGIYGFITRNYPWYRTCDKGWQNSIRHNLSLNRYFIKVPRNQEEPGKGSFWRIDPSCEDKLIQFAFRKRRQRSSRIRSAPVSPSPSARGDSTQSGEELIDVITCETTRHENDTNHHKIHYNQPMTGTPSSEYFDVTSSKEVVSNVDQTNATHNGDHQQVLEKRRVFTFSPMIDTSASRMVSQSAPCSPKGFGINSKETINKREHHHSGGSGSTTFRVRTGAKDGRHRLQLCHTPPEYIPVPSSDISALHALSSGSRRSSLLQRHRGGSKSLSTTPVRELLAVGGPMKIKENAERLAQALLEGPVEPKVLKDRPTVAVENGQNMVSVSNYQHQYMSRASAIVEPTAAAVASMFSSGVPGGLMLVTRPVAIAPGLTSYTSNAGAYFPQLLQTAALYPSAGSAGLISEYAAAAYPLCPTHATFDPRFLAAAAATVNAKLDSGLAGPPLPKVAKLE